MVKVMVVPTMVVSVVPTMVVRVVPTMVVRVVPTMVVRVVPTMVKVSIVPTRKNDYTNHRQNQDLTT